MQKNSKLGLALSGGGFRASLFHIGVLAKMAEQNLLKEVQVISTVSGGSIIGALYYLKIKELLEGKKKDEQGNIISPSQQAYLQIVEEISKEFLEAVQKNIRLRTFLNPVKNAKMLSADYSRSDRIAELYTKHIYQNVWNNISGGAGKQKNLFFRLWDWMNGNPNTNIFLKDLKIIPHDSVLPEEMKLKSEFDFDLYQQKAEYKIPVLVINATTLNTGNCWQFTAASVREVPPAFPLTNSNSTFSKLRYDGQQNDDSGLNEKENKKRIKKLNALELSDAVAASAAVPGVFVPFSIHDLYKDIVVQLVDGGVYDNQGINTLITEWNCTDVICSDASGQLTDDRKPSNGIFGVVSRTNDILMDRVRDYEVEKLIKGSDKHIFFHLRDSESEKVFDFMSEQERKKLSESIADIRTDLDSFSDIEALTLMHFGYKLSGQYFQKKYGAENFKKTWNFNNVEPCLMDNKKRKKIIRHLSVSKKSAWKIFHLNATITILTLFPFACLLLYGVFLLIQMRSEELIPKIFSDITKAMPPLTVFEAVGWIGLTIGFFYLDKILQNFGKWMRFVRLLSRGFGPAAIRAFLPFAFTSLASVLIFSYLKIYGWLYLREGKL